MCGLLLTLPVCRMAPAEGLAEMSEAFMVKCRGRDGLADMLVQGYEGPCVL